MTSSITEVFDGLVDKHGLVKVSQVPLLPGTRSL